MRCLVELLAEIVRLGRRDMIYIRYIQRLGCLSHVAGNTLLVDGQDKGRVDEFVTLCKALLQGVVLGIGELERILFSDVD